MQITEVTNEGLKREFAIVVEAAELEQRIDTLVQDLKTRMRMPGFRPGKVPPSLIRKMHGEALRGQVVQEAVNENTEKLMKERNLRPALQPDVEITKNEDDTDLEYKVEMEILPEIESPDFSDLKLERLAVDVDDAQVEEALERLAGQQKSFTAAAKTYKAKSGDAVVIDFVGKIDGEAFEGGSGEQYQLELGSGTFIPGFEEQLEGVKTGDKLAVTVNFPKEYHAKELAGKEAVFDVTVGEVKKPEEAKIDDDLAKNLGLDDLNALRNVLKEQLERELSAMSRTNLKRRLLDALADRFDFIVPEKMVDAEYQQIWETLLRQVGEDEAKELEENDAEKAEYRAIAERRVRLGLLLAEVGQVNNVDVRPEEVNRLIAEEARRFPGQEQQVFEFYRNNPGAMAQLRAPLYEDKVVDYILELAEITEKKITRDALEAILNAEDEEEAAPKPKKKAASKKKKAPAKTAKTTSKTDDAKAGDKKPAAKKTAEKKAPAKQAPAKKAPAKTAAASKTSAKKTTTAKKTAAKKKDSE